MYAHHTYISTYAVHDCRIAILYVSLPLGCLHGHAKQILNRFENGLEHAFTLKLVWSSEKGKSGSNGCGSMDRRRNDGASDKLGYCLLP